MSAGQFDVDKPYFVVARQPDHQSGNRMHEDALPQKLGFRGAFVLGVALYGAMTRALAARFGEEWLGCAAIEVKFLRPVCEGDRLRIETAAIPGREQERAYEVTMYNETANNEVSARMVSSLPAAFPPVDATASLQPNEWEGPVTERRTWNTAVVGRAYRSFRHTLSRADNAHWKGIVGDDLPIYEQGDRPPVHPAFVLRQVQLGYNNQFIGESAVHASSKALVRRMLRVGDPVHLLTVPLEKWERKQNHWLTIYCAVRRGDEVCAEIYHTQIFKLRGVESPASAQA